MINRICLKINKLNKFDNNIITFLTVTTYVDIDQCQYTFSLKISYYEKYVLNCYY